MNKRRYAAVEAGGTKFVCAVADEDGTLLELQRLPTRDPASTLREVGDYFEQASQRLGRFDALGVASFGPIELARHSTGFGHITHTPKPGWSHTNLCGQLQARLGAIAVGFDTDVNAAAMAELALGAGRGLDHLVYLTVGTGIGGGVVVAGQPVHGLMHPELGHLFPRRQPDDVFAGICPFHGDCFEGLACGPAIQARLGVGLSSLAPADPFWDVLADYLGQLCAQLVLVVAPQRIVMGGGVMQQLSLFPLLRERLRHWLNGYVAVPALQHGLEQFVVPPGLGDRAGILGAMLLARQADRDAGHRPAD